MACASAPVGESAEKRPTHHTDSGFTNPHSPLKKTSFLRFLRMRLFGEEDWPDFGNVTGKIPVTAIDLEKLRNPEAAPQITWIGHATVLIQYRGLNILTDPHFSDRASPVSWAGPKRFSPLPLALDQLPPIDLVLLSHNHYDSLDMASVRGLGNRPTWLVPLQHKEWFTHAGIAPEKVIEFDWWQSRRVLDTIVTCTPTQHWSKRSPWDTNKALWSGWAIKIDDFTLWFAGDTGYNPVHFKEIGRRFDGFDLALIPIGGYAPRWFMKIGHVTPEEAVTIHQEVGARTSLGIHWGSFPLTAEPVDEPPKRLKAAVEAAGLSPRSFEAWAIGETRSFPW